MRTAREALVGATEPFSTLRSSRRTFRCGGGAVVEEGSHLRGPAPGPREPCRRGPAASRGGRATAARPTGQVGAVPRPRGSIRDRQPHPLLRARHLGPAVRPVVADPVRRPRGGPPAGGHLRTGGQAPPPRARMVRPHRTAPARRAAHPARPPRRPGPDRIRRGHPARRAQPHRPGGAPGRFPQRRQRQPHPRLRAQPGRRAARGRARRGRAGHQGHAAAGEGGGGRAGGRRVPRARRGALGVDRHGGHRGRERRRRRPVPRRRDRPRRGPGPAGQHRACGCSAAGRRRWAG